MIKRKRNFATVLSFGCLAVVAAFSMAACGGETEPPATNDGPCGAPSAIQGQVGSACGVFAASSGDDANEGTKSKPVLTLAKAVALAKTAGKPVYACAETFAEAVEVTGGVTIYGGLDCKAAGWPYVGAASKTVIAPGPDKVPLKLFAGEGPVHLEDIAAQAADAAMLGASSIAAIASGATVEFVRCDLTAGAGAPGVAGEQPTGGGGPMTPDDPEIVGNAGIVACMGGAAGNAGGAAKTNGLCDVSIGGSGGKGAEGMGSVGESGAPAPDPNPDGFGAGGIGGMALSGCQNGKTGAAGADGTPGVGAQELGSIDAMSYTGAVGGSGMGGAPGQGGGGGGGSSGKPNCHGPSGGSGGAGGCGGNGGNGGKGGGASFALMSIDSSIQFTETTLTAGSGGKGGDGGGGQAGGVGGTGGLGGAGTTGVQPACNGGAGGSGGIGGMGGGGRGGHSAAVAFKGGSVDLGGATPKFGAPGSGGHGEGEMGNGAEGVASDVIEFK